MECQRCHKNPPSRPTSTLCIECERWYQSVRQEMTDQAKALTVTSTRELSPLLAQAWQTVRDTPSSDYDAKIQAVLWKDALESRERLLARQEHEAARIKGEAELASDRSHERMKPKYTNRPGDALHKRYDDEKDDDDDD